jgi:signal transduction histidine kinase
MLGRKNDRLEVYHELLTHDAPNYITAVYGYLQIIQGQELPREKLQKYIDTSVKQTEALNHMIDTARTLRQLETTPLGLTESMDIRTMVEQAISAVVATNAGKPSEIQDRIPPGRFLVRGEPNLEEVFRIVINNAVRYSDSPRVSVDLVDEGDNWHIKFTDNGRGIPDDKKEFLFLRFDRLDKQRKIRGSGLSLALARALVERHGGRIWVENTVPGDYTKGSVFHVVLPKPK